ncbi:MAG: hypothetical protein N3B18_00015 [Desulfobacterota bacterium]|nr:hypothetical protein [Thermodesulfobacteriota bacterium]
MESRIQRMHEEFIATRRVTVPEDLLPRTHGYNLLAWAQELVTYYEQHGIVVRPFDDLPQFRISGDETISVTVQDIHRFIISDVNMIPIEIRKHVLTCAVRHPAPAAAWERIAERLQEYLRNTDDNILREDLSWKFSPIAELLWALTWFFLEREQIRPPATVRFIAHRFPYYVWEETDNRHNFWEPEEPMCRWEWLAIDLYRRLVHEKSIK